MNYRIYWKNRDNGRNGTGPKPFTKEEAEALAEQLNAAHPHIDHVAIDVVTMAANVAPMEPEPVAAPVPPPRFTPLSDDDLFPNWGIHARKRMGSIDSSYWDWMRGQVQLLKAWPAIADYIERNKRSINQDLERAER